MVPRTCHKLKLYDVKLLDLAISSPKINKHDVVDMIQLFRYLSHAQLNSLYTITIAVDFSLDFVNWTMYLTNSQTDGWTNIYFGYHQ